MGRGPADRPWLAGAATLGALLLRLRRLDARGLWSDEGGSARYASLPIPELLATISAYDPHPPLYYLLLALWLPLGGPSDFAVRLPSALFGTLAVPALYALGRRIGGRASGRPIFAAQAAFGTASLVGFDARGEPRPSGRVVVGLHFAPEGPYPRDLEVFVHLIDGAGKIVTQHDGPPCGGGCPTSSRSGGELIVDEHAVELPGALPAGQYELVVGLYDATTGDRVRRTDAAPADQPDRVVLGAIRVEG
ncbi:MAG TPA: glycosyltransferase family 39 protein [Chloroflexota bacterium]|jgi:hypothetical protein|nr:glycosyltransferase family 39 protein [Chloroflexota bacterium]